MTRPRPSPDRRARSGLRLVPDLEPRPRACDDETLVLPGRIYVIPVWEISGKTGMINLYEADPATGKHLTGRDGSLTLVGQVPSAQLARADAQPRLVWDYVGQTIRELAVREAEHEEDKCWADIKADRITLVEQGLWNKQTRDGKEIAAIAKIKPRFNKEYNEHNPGRIPIWRQVELRHLRDDALHRERWLPLEQRSVAAQAAAARAIVGAGLDGNEPRYPLDVLGDVLKWLWSHRGAGPAWLRQAATALLLWLVLTALAGVGLTSWLGWPTDRALLGGAIAAAELLGVPLGGRRKRRRRRKR